MLKRILTIVLVLSLAFSNLVFGAEANTPNIKTIKKESKKALRATLASLKSTKKSAYVDLTGDEVKDLFVKGAIYTYNYKKKTVKKIYLSDGETPLNKIKGLYISKKKKRIYVTIGSYELEGRNQYTYYLRGCFFKMKDIRKATKSDEGDYFLARELYYVALVNEPEHFVSKKKYKSGADYFKIDYSWNDQDDAWYNLYTSKQLNKKIKKMMPGKKKIKLKNKVKI